MMRYCIVIFLMSLLGHLSVSGQPMPIPVIDSVTVTNSNKILITWHIAPDARVAKYVVYRKAPDNQGFIVIDTIRNILQTTFTDMQANPETERWLYSVASVSSTDSLSGLANPHSLPILSLDSYDLCNQTLDVSWLKYEGVENVSYTIVCEIGSTFYSQNNTGNITNGKIRLKKGNSHRITVRTKWSGGSSTAAYLQFTSDSIRINRELSFKQIANAGDYWNIQVNSTPERDRDSLKVRLFYPDSNVFYNQQAEVANNADNIIEFQIPVAELETHFLPVVVDICGNEYRSETKVGSIKLEVVQKETHSELRWNSVYNGNNMQYSVFTTQPRHILLEDVNSRLSYIFEYNMVPETDEYCFQVVASNGSLDITSNIVCISLDDNLLWPNAFTPRIGEYNNYFGPVVKLFEPEAYKLVVFNKLGSIIFSSNNINDRWDGAVSGTLVPKGGYPFSAEYVIAGKKYVKQGIVTVIY